MASRAQRPIVRNMSSQESAPVKDPQVVYRDLANEEGGLLLHVESGQYHGVNGTGSAIWKLIDGTRTVAEIAAALALEFNGAQIDFAKEVDRFVDDLRRRGLLVL
jgi:Coenzyme PQQ synthesis protein D (PqqD)